MTTIAPVLAARDVGALLDQREHLGRRYRFLLGLLEALLTRVPTPGWTTPEPLRAQLLDAAEEAERVEGELVLVRADIDRLLQLEGGRA